MEIGQFKIGQQLSLMNRCDLLNRLIFDDYGMLHNHIGPEARINFHVSIMDRHGNFALDNQTVLLKFVGQTSLVSRLQEPRSQSLVDLDGSMDDLFGDAFDFH